MTDLAASASTIAAVTACAAAATAVLFDAWTQHRKHARRRFGALVAQANWNPEAIQHQVIHEFGELRRRTDTLLYAQLKLDLEKLALLAIMDDRIIIRTAEELGHEFQTGHIEAKMKANILDFFGDWLASQTPVSAFPMPKDIDLLRGQYEFAKKRKMLFQAVHRAIA